VSYLLAFAGFSALIILHELGHFAAAKAVGMRVERFSLFFPPLIWRWRPKRSETEYAIGATPLGGYVKITGMNPAEDIPPEVLPRAYFRQPVWCRASRQHHPRVPDPLAPVHGTDADVRTAGGGERAAADAGGAGLEAR
jgi:hypothetical protein